MIKKNGALDAEETEMLNQFKLGKLKLLANQQEETARIKKYISEKHKKQQQID